MRNNNIHQQVGNGKAPPFPYRVITEKDRDEAFRKLQNLNFEKGESLSLSSVGNKASNYYFQKYRVKTKVGKWSHWDKWHDKEKREKLIEVDKQLHRGSPKVIGTPAGLNSAMRMSGNSVNQFKPYVGVYIYQLFKPKRILDITAGWGDRLVSAMSQNIDYIGIDTNKSLKTPYGRMIKHFSQFSTSKVIMKFMKAENVEYDKLPKYDLIFTSPPYFSLEKYRGMEKFKDDEDFVKSFFIPAISGAYGNLTKGGHMALNMPEEMMLILKPIYGAPKCIKMPIHSRFSYKSKKKRFECIYVWKKL